MNIPLKWLGEYVKLPKDTKDLTDKLTSAGHMLDKIQKTPSDTIIDLELRGNRADCYSIIGIAREIQALYNTPVVSPEVHKNLNKVSQLKACKITTKSPYVKRIVAIAIKDIKLEPSPKWLADRLTAYGVTLVNNIVDLTNCVMIETGQPMHAFDLDTLGSEVHIRLANKGEKMKTFQDKNLSLHLEDLVWANKDSVISMAGAIGEKHHSISKSTKNVLLEAANYDRANIRRSIHRHNLFTDAGIRHEKDLDPNMVSNAIYRFLHLLTQNKWGRVDPEIFDFYPKPIKPWKMNLNFETLNLIGGTNINPKLVFTILESLNFKILQKTNKSLLVSPPTYRTDVRLEEDVIEEILRINGYDNIPTRTLSLEIPKTITPNFINQEEEIKNSLTSIGFDEIISLPFVSQKLQRLNKKISSSENKFVEVQNAPSPDLKTMRLSLLPNLYQTTKRIINERGKESILFELGKIYFHSKDKYLEERKLGLIYWESKGDYSKFKGLIESLFEKLNISDLNFIISKNTNLLQKSYELSIDKETIGRGGQIDNIFYAEIDLDKLLPLTQKSQVKLWPKYPPQIEDITFTVPQNSFLGEIVNAIQKSDKSITQVDLIDTYENTYTFRINYQNPQKTLTNQEVLEIKKKFVKILETKFSVKIK
jgi:phenylalanyl-tRNA synthetase beta chain